MLFVLVSRNFDFDLILYVAFNCYSFINLTFSKFSADRLPKPCSKSVPDYNDCSLEFLRKFKSNMINGISELNIPTYNPFHLPIYVLNRVINNTVSITAVITEGRIWGFETMEIKSFKWVITFSCSFSYILVAVSIIRTF